ncbi:hypothetical protein NM688_g5280 [Phlebia brevispora]|uniref:Uncharacterized protein n=1 Tax=Phlebia brevispora TaxID=194682 RepID=A0ACC1SXY4_9APHY|nr:hypothetical protein NM688_g5280 [Phlebia brevispora]
MMQRAAVAPIELYFITAHFLTTMSEQQPLLFAGQHSTDRDAESGTGRPDCEKGYLARCRERTAETLESRPWHYTVITDSACVLADLAYTVLSDTCTPVEGPDAPLWLNVLSDVSLAINTLFLAEIPITLWAMGPSFYNPLGSVLHASLHLFDAFVIIATFVLEVVLKGRERELAGLLIILRLWRLVKLVGGIAVSAGEIEEGTAEQLAETQAQLDRALKDLQQAQDENSKLRARLTWMDNDDATIAGTYTESYMRAQ